MKILVRLLPFLLPLFGLTSFEAFANCEAGGYSIHTVAEYKKPAPAQSYLIYKVEGTEIKAHFSALDSEVVPKVLAGPLELKVGSETCALVSGLSVDPKYVPDDPYSSEYPLQAKAGGCTKLLAKAAVRGYLLLDLEKKKLQLPVELKVAAGSLQDAEIKSVSAEVEADARRRKLFLYTDLSVSSDPAISRRPLSATDIDGVRTEVFTVGQGPTRFVMAVAILRVKGLVSVLPPSGDMEDPFKDLIQEWKKHGGKEDFPVIYFRPAGSAKSLYVGDGSACSQVKYQQYEQPVAGAGGSFDRFKITHAFDLDGDGKVDVLEINERFAYRLLPDGKPEVIQYGQGC